MDAPKPVSIFRRGLVALLPILLTVGLLHFLVSFLFDKIGRPLGVLLEKISQAAFAHPPFPAGSPFYPILGFLVALVAIFLLGALVATFVGRRIYRLFEWFLVRLPLVRTIYPYAKQVTEYFVSADKKFEFKNAVAVPFPTSGLWSIGFMTAEGLRAINDAGGARTVTVFVPTAPTPFTGFVIFVPREDVVPLPISVEEALRILISCGILMPPGQTARSDLRVVPPGAYPLPPGHSP